MLYLIPYDYGVSNVYPSCCGVLVPVGLVHMYGSRGMVVYLCRLAVLANLTSDRPLLEAKEGKFGLDSVLFEPVSQHYLLESVLYV